MRANPHPNPNAPVKRPLESSDGPPTQKRQLLPDESAQIQSDLLRRLVHTQPDDAPRLTRFLAALDQGIGPNDVDHEEVQAFFNELIVREEYDALVEAFATWHQAVLVSAEPSRARPRSGTPGIAHQTPGLKDGFPAHAPPVTTCLQLDLPAGWSPRDRNGFCNALKAMKVDQVEVPSSAVMTPVTTVALVTLVNNGTRELVLRSPQAVFRPEALARALSGSSLASITLGPVENGTHIDPLAVASYQTVLRGLAHCTTLKELRVVHQDLFELHTVIAEFMQSAGPRLQTVEVQAQDGDWSRIPERRRNTLLSHAIQLMHALKQQPLVRLDVHLPLADALQLDLLCLIPFAHHSHLESLEVNSDKPMNPDAASLRALLNLLEFSITCPQLTCLSAKFFDIPSAGQRMQMLKRAGIDIIRTDEGAALLGVLRSPSFKLTDLEVGGLLLVRAFTDALFGELIVGKKMRSFSAIGGAIELRSTFGFDRLRGHPTLHTLGLPDACEHYYLDTPEGPVFGLAPPEGDHFVPPKSVVPTYEGPVTDEVRAALQKVFTEEMARHATTFWHALQHVMQKNHDERLRAIREARQIGPHGHAQEPSFNASNSSNSSNSSGN